MLNWDDEHKVLTDYMGLPLSRSEVLALREQINRHLKRSGADLAHIAHKVAMKKFPGSIQNVNTDPENYE